MKYRIVKTKGANTGVFVSVEGSEALDAVHFTQGDCDLVVSIAFYESPDPSSRHTYALHFCVSSSSLEQARRSALEVVYYLDENFGIPEESVDLTYNGAGNVLENDTSASAPAEIVILVPPVVFGDRSTPLMPIINCQLARQMHDDGIENIDLDVYIQKHFVPLPNSINTATGRLNVTLTMKELLYLAGNRILELSKQPRLDDLVALPQYVPEAAEWFDEILAEFEKKQHRQNELRRVIERQGWEVPPCIRRILWLKADQGTVFEASRLISGVYSFLGSSEAEIHYHIQRLAKRNDITSFHDQQRLQRIMTFGIENPWLFSCGHNLLQRYCPGDCVISELIRDYEQPGLFGKV